MIDYMPYYDRLYAFHGFNIMKSVVPGDRDSTMLRTSTVNLARRDRYHYQSDVVLLASFRFVKSYCRNSNGWLFIDHNDISTLHKLQEVK